LINIIKKVLEENKKNWHKKLVNALWADRLITKRSIGTSPYELVYGMEAAFPSSLGIPVIKLLQEIQAELIKQFIYSRPEKKCIKELRFYKRNLRRFLTKGQRQRIFS